MSKSPKSSSTSIKPKQSNKAKFLKRAGPGASLGLHIDEAHDAACEFGGIRGQVNAMPQGYDGMPGLVVSSGGSTVSPLPAGKSFGNIDDAAYPTQNPMAVAAKAGSVTFWTGNGVHANCKQGHTLSPLFDAELSFTDALANPHKIRANLRDFGACVVTDVLAPEECARFKRACVTAIEASRQDPENSFKGFGGSSLPKMYGISTNEALRFLSVHPRILALWAVVLFDDPSRGDALCTSPDAIAVSAIDNGKGDLDATLTRATMIMCYGKAEDQQPGEGARKLDHYRNGGTCNHPPCKFTNGGKGGHYSNGGGGPPGPDNTWRWVPQVPTWGADPKVDADFVHLLGP